LQQAFPCPKCGAQIPVGQQFCTTCGQHFEYRCRLCGAAVKSGFCTNCGTTLHQQTQSTKPSAKRAITTHQGKKARQKAAMPQPIGQVGRYLIFVFVIIFIGAILYAIGTGQEGETSNWFGGSFIFGGKSPPSTPPTTDTIQKPKPDSDLPQYTTGQVIAVAKKTSPHCRVPTRRTG